jgi:hypothetical protein
MPDSPLLYLIAVAVVFAVAAWAGWAIAGRRPPKPSVLPDRVWLCEGCQSFNDPTHVTCYRCHRPRPIDARYVEPDPEFHVDQQLGRPKGSTQLGASNPWLAGEEPLRDAWLAERARASEPASEPAPDRAAPAPEDVQPAPAFWTAAAVPGADPEAEPSPDRSPEPPGQPPEHEPPAAPG